MKQRSFVSKKNDRPSKKPATKGNSTYIRPTASSQRQKNESGKASSTATRKNNGAPPPKPVKAEQKHKAAGTGKPAQERETKKKPQTSPKRSLKKFEEADLSFGRKKRPDEPKKNLPNEEVTFSKTIEKWDTPPVTPTYGAAGKKNPFNQEKSNKSKFQRRFEHDDTQKAYSGAKNLHRKLRPNPHAQKNYYAAEPAGAPMPLNKFIAHCDVCSRRDAVPLIKAGKVKVNGNLVVEPGFKVTVSDEVTLSGKKLSVQKDLVYLLLNKPKGYITTTDDPKGRRTVMDIFEHQIDQRIFPVGRLDRNTTGLLLLTNDGDLTQHLAHPKYEVQKIYQVTLNKKLSDKDFETIKNGVILEDGPAPVDKISFLDNEQEIGLEIHNGKNRIVRRIFESLGYEVEKLDRVLYAGLTKKNLPRGKWRFLTKQEVINLKHLKK